MIFGLILINSLATGGIYAILAVGFSLIFGVARLSNFSHTAIYVLAAFVLYIFVSIVGWNVWISSIIALVVATGVALLYYFLIIDRVKAQHLAVLVCTFALSMLIQEGLLFFFHAAPRGIMPYVDGYFEVGDIRVTYQHVFSILACAVIIAGVVLMLAKTKLGHAIRAVSQDQEIANVMGINVGSILFICMGISALLAALAAVVVLPLFAVDPYGWMNPMLVIIAAVVLGGMGSIKGSIIGAFILGTAEVMVVTLLPEGGFLRGVISLLVMVVVLLFKPEGLFGVYFEEERL